MGRGIRLLLRCEASDRSTDEPSLARCTRFTTRRERSRAVHPRSVPSLRSLPPVHSTPDRSRMIIPAQWKSDLFVGRKVLMESGALFIGERCLNIEAFNALEVIV